MWVGECVVLGRNPAEFIKAGVTQFFKRAPGRG